MIEQFPDWDFANRSRLGLGGTIAWQVRNARKVASDCGVSAKGHEQLTARYGSGLQPRRRVVESKGGRVTRALRENTRDYLQGSDAWRVDEQGAHASKGKNHPV